MLNSSQGPGPDIITRAEQDMEQSRRIVSKVVSARFAGRFVEIDGITFTTPESLVIYLRYDPSQEPVSKRDTHIEVGHQPGQS